MKRLEGARGLLATLWGLSFVGAVAIPFLVYARGGIELSNLTPSVGDISGVYAPHIGAILAYYFATRRRGKSKNTRQTPVVLAIAISTLWNAVVLALLAPPLWGGGALTEATSTAKEMAPQLAWIVAPVLGYFFAKAAE
jgi:hypothetical protein